MIFSTNTKFALFLFSSLFLQACSQSQMEDEFNYDDRTGKGPSSWGTLKPEWRTCSVGQRQSPINIRTVQVSSQLRDLQRNYRLAKADLLNTTVNVEVNFIGDAGSISINGTVYRVQNIHWHSPSEHTFDGVRFPLEVHIVHRSDQNTRAVVSMLYRIGQPDLFLATISPSLSLLRQTERPLGLVNPEQVGFQGSSYYRYDGSITVPPCTENVVWTVYLKINQASENQIRRLRNVLPPQNRNNSRPTQPLNNRDVLFRPGGESSIDNI